ncbi:glycosyl hydrolase, partial [bacterium]
MSDLDEKSLVYRAPFSSAAGVKPYLVPDPDAPSTVRAAQVVDLTAVARDGTLRWNVPPGRWTILRFGRTLTGQTTRPAPDAGLGFETDKFETRGIESHLATFIDSIVKQTGPNVRRGRGLTMLHFDSWEMGAQNWSPHFRRLFRERRGYDPLPYLPVMAGRIVDSVNVSERFLWDLRQTAQELVIANHLGPIRARAKRYGLGLDVEPYDMNPTSDLALGATADVPMGEFWSKGFGYDSEYSVNEAVSIAHTNGRPIVGAEAFTADERDGWLQHPASMKAQTDWALATGINRFAIHRYQHQPDPNAFPGMTMGPYGVHWERTQTWWDLVPAYHRYLARCQNVMRQGLPVADIL